MKILPGVGIGSVKFGMKEDEVIEILGVPDETEELEHIEGENDWYRELYYSHEGISLSFNSEDDFRLGNISITGKGHTLLGQVVLGTDINQTKKLILQISSKQPVYEDCTWGKAESSELLNLDNLGLMFWFKSGVWDELICS
ncbi:MAG: hypothetical protein HRU24_14550 [Gammaproteobacteria bacterium]|nr:hypothetical protein [Gammaproteobacteria bacterium]